MEDSSHSAYSPDFSQVEKYVAREKRAVPPSARVILQIGQKGQVSRRLIRPELNARAAEPAALDTWRTRVSC